MTNQPHSSSDDASSPHPSAGRLRLSRRRWRRALFISAAALALTAAAGTVLVSLAASPALVVAIGAALLGAGLFEAGRRSARRALGRLYDAAIGPTDEGEGLGDLVICRDDAGRITSTNTATTARLGQSPGAFIGLDFSTFAADLAAGDLFVASDVVASDVHQPRADPWQQLRRRLTALAALSGHGAGEQSINGLLGDIRIETVDGPRWFSFSEAPIVEDGRVTGTRTLGRDITERKAIEAALEKTRDEAEAASAAKSRFLAMVSHEIRTPLNGILGMTALMQKTPLSAEQRTYARAIETSGEALLTLIEDLLDFSKIEAGRLSLQLEPTSLATIVEDLVELMAPRAEMKGIELAAYIDPRLDRLVQADPIRVRQVLFNLAGNGIKFTAEGGVAIELQMTNEEDGAVGVSFLVRDTGIGIAEADQQRIFGEFEQADPGPARSHGGTGLGLAIARELTRLMGGDIRLISTPGEGASFSFALRFPLAEAGMPIAIPTQTAPVETADIAEVPSSSDAVGARAALALLTASFAAKGDAPLPAPSVSPPTDRRFAGRRILVVSHALIEGPFLIRRLFDAGADVTLATQKDIEQEVVGSWQPDAVLIDAAAGDPLAVIERIRAFSTTPVGVLISATERPMLPELQAAGYGAYLVKPVRARSLSAVIETLLGHGQFAAAAEPVLAEPPSPPHRLSVLLCDDNEINLLLGRALVERAGHAVTLSADGQKALTATAAMLSSGGGFDVVLMDLHMPEMDGIEAARRIRAMIADRDGRQPVIAALTADALPETRARCEDGLFDAWLSKPLRPADLESLLEASANGEVAHAS
ncbi:hybrid sensor histidine kinase/response regulator [Pleomorphomonas diazotrophica]|uniref:histidine kinase n=1 Tax=Pleomorphomonas diazotrophica TaxID=1166257 RepID=A0A1I4SVE4_9HYPH|nr:ATP-binding protein [Pleomorphomonas diazotrophica]PKR88561.1 hybrid sensor histidine kinase/response regulator [Pleomorphomonas diazotrophica]SFM68412.1 Signal transduction histidine kinase [Pleomorphomonas diazotrophica]